MSLDVSVDVPVDDGGFFLRYHDIILYLFLKRSDDSHGSFRVHCPLYILIHLVVIDVKVQQSPIVDAKGCDSSLWKKRKLRFHIVVNSIGTVSLFLQST